jgi:hypothetical protein
MMQSLKKKTSTLLLLTTLAFPLQYSVRTLVADVLFTMAPRLLDDKNTEALDLIDISEETLPAYHAAIMCIRQASLWDPGNSTYIKAQADLYDQLGTWTGVIKQVGDDLPEGMMSESEAQGRTKDLLTDAINLEPSNPDYHLALYSNKLACWQDEKLTSLRSDNTGCNQIDKTASFLTDDLEKAVLLYPNNSPIRYTVAVQYLLLGEKNKALEHAKVLAARDDSYRLPDRTGSDSLIERRSALYLSFLAQSYLAKAFEIAWRASEQDYLIIKAMTPDEREARDVLELFIAMKDVDQNIAVKNPLN